jgi:hypothetical protein
MKNKQIQGTVTILSSFLLVSFLFSSCRKEEVVSNYSGPGSDIKVTLREFYTNIPLPGKEVKLLLGSTGIFGGSSSDLKAIFETDSMGTFVFDRKDFPKPEWNEHYYVCPSDLGLNYTYDCQGFSMGSAQEVFIEVYRPAVVHFFVADIPPVDTSITEVQLKVIGGLVIATWPEEMVPGNPYTINPTGYIEHERMLVFVTGNDGVPDNDSTSVIQFFPIPGQSNIVNIEF